MTSTAVATMGRKKVVKLNTQQKNSYEAYARGLSDKELDKEWGAVAEQVQTAKEAYEILKAQADTVETSGPDGVQLADAGELVNYLQSASLDPVNNEAIGAARLHLQNMQKKQTVLQGLKRDRHRRQSYKAATAHVLKNEAVLQAAIDVINEHFELAKKDGWGPAAQLSLGSAVTLKRTIDQARKLAAGLK